VDNQPGKGVAFRLWLPMEHATHGEAVAA